jgi:cystathionine gamma-synthase
MHSATKYLNGHSDVVAGAVIGRKTRTDAGSDVFPKVWDRLLRARSFGGSVLGPFEAWLLLRGMRTLHVRVRAQCATAAALANKLRSHPCVAAVYYPGLETHPGHAVARAQQSSPFSFSANACATTGSNDQKDQKMFGGMLSVRCVGGGKAAVMTTSMTKVWFPATSLGGVESLVEHRKTVEGPSSETPDDLLRLSVGLEHADDLYRDLSEALWDAHGRIMSSAKWRKMQDARKALEENGR